MIELYDTVRLKTGEKCTIIDVTESDKAYVGEVERSDSVDGIEIEPIKQEDIAEKLQIKAWFKLDGKYILEDCFQDIISAITKNEIETPTGHRDEYWERPGNVAKEIFANMSAIDVLDSPTKAEFDGLLKDIYLFLALKKEVHCNVMD